MKDDRLRTSLALRKVAEASREIPPRWGAGGGRWDYEMLSRGGRFVRTKDAGCFWKGVDFWSTSQMFIGWFFQKGGGSEFLGVLFLKCFWHLCVEYVVAGLHFTVESSFFL